MIVVAIIGLLAALAVPSFRMYVVRAHGSEGLYFVSAYKVQLAEQIMLTGRIPDDAGDPANVDYYETGGSGVVRRVRWSRQRAALEVWYGSDAGSELNGAILWLIPHLGADGGVAWTCRGHPDADFYMNPAYLPSTCRG